MEISSPSTKANSESAAHVPTGLRWFAALLFLGGGAVAFVGLMVATALGNSIAGMSAGTTPSKGHLDFWIAVSVEAFFGVSCFGLMLSRKRSLLKNVSWVAHLALGLGYLLLCMQGLTKSNGRFVSDALKLGIVGMVFFSPWILLWCFCLFKDFGRYQPKPDISAGSAESVRRP